MRLEITASAIAVALCLADILTTNYVVTTGIGYESNEILSPIIGFHLYVFKLLFMAMAVVVIAKANIGLQLKLASYSTLIIFYSLVVMNNTLVILQDTDLDLNLGKLFLIFAAIFAINILSSHVLIKSR